MLAAALCLAVPAYAQAPAADRNFVVFFETWSGALDRQADAVIAAAAKRAMAAPTDKVVVTGTADPIGSARANALVSALRAQMVADALVSAGVPADRINQVAYGSTEYTFSMIEARRVSIAVLPK
jgi:outer membrane protein OmpA-like peptidoglycan-associated protein